MTDYNQSNVGSGMVPHKKGCRCDECELEQVQRRYRCVQNDMRKASKTIDKQQEEIERLTAELEQLRFQRDLLQGNLEDAYADLGKGQPWSAQDAAKIANTPLPTKNCDHDGYGVGFRGSTIICLGCNQVLSDKDSSE